MGGVRARTVAVAALAVGLLAGCGDDPPAADPTATASPTARPAAAGDARAQLAARAAAAKDRRYAALYMLSTGDRPDRTVVVTPAAASRPNAVGHWRGDGLIRLTRAR